MATLKSLRNRIGAIHSTKKITKAMKLISSAKYLNTKNILKDVLPYHEKIETIAKSLLNELDEDVLKDCPYISCKSNVDNKLTILIIITSDKGLCGSFNINVLKALAKKTAELEANQQKYMIYCVGNKGFELIKKRYKISLIEKVSLSLNIIDIENFMNKLMQVFQNQEASECCVIFNEYKAHSSNQTVIHALLPYNKTSNSSSLEPFKKYEPAPHLQLLPILKRRLYINIKIALLESIVSEHLARMLAMDSATNNAQEMVDKLTLLYNRTRQGNITRELIEIISGAEALNAN